MNQDIAEVQLYVYIKDEMRNLFAENVKVYTRLDISDKKLRVISNNMHQMFYQKLLLHMQMVHI